MDNKQQRQLEQLKDFNSLVQATAALEDTPEMPLEERYSLELKKNKLLDMATELSYVYPKDVHDIWVQYMPENESIPPLVQKAYDKLSDEKKASTESVLQAAADQEARDSNLHKILFRAIERIDAKYLPKGSLPGYDDDEARGAFYVEIRDVFAERDYAIEAPERQMPSFEDALALTKFLAAHNDPEQRAQLESLGEAHLQRSNSAREMTQTDFDFGNVVEPEQVQQVQFANLAELIEHLAPLAKEGQIMAGPRDTVLYLDAETNALTLATLSEAAAGELSNEMGGNGTDIEYTGNRITFRSADFDVISTSLAKLTLEEKDRNSLRSVVRQVMNKRIPDISDTAMERARELRQARLIELAKLARKEAAKAEPQPAATSRNSDNDVANAELIPTGSVKTVPPQVVRAYVRIPDRKGDRFYLNSRLDTVAFVDKGAKLETKSDNEKTALDMVSIAEARGWETIKVSGTEAFRRQVWLEASARGLTVRGYKPNEMDKALLAQRTDQLEKNEANAIEQVDHRARSASNEDSKTADKPAGKEVAAQAPHEDAMPADKPVPTSSKANNLSGTLLEHGKAPFEFKADNKPNYFVKYRDDAGTERITWGLDLERAIAESEAKAGDKISLENLGKRQVEVQANVRDDSGKVVGTKTITTHRNSWNVEVARDFLEMPTKEFAAKHPSQVNAAVISAFTNKAIAEHPKFEALSSTDKERLRSGVQAKIADAVGDGKSLPALSVVTRTRKQEVVAEVVRETSRSR